MAKTKTLGVSDGMFRFNRVHPIVNVLFSLLFILLAVMTFMPVIFVFMISISSEAS